MAVATQKSHPDFIFTTLRDYQKSILGQPDEKMFQQVVTRFTPEAFYTLRKYLHTVGDPTRATALDLVGQMFSLAGCDNLWRALFLQEAVEIAGHLQEASRIFGLGHDPFHKQCADDFLSLRKDQQVLRQKYNDTEIIPSDCTSVMGTITAVISYATSQPREQHRLFTDADKIAKKFRVPEKRLWHAKVKALKDSQQWSNLKLLAESSRKPPIGLVPFCKAVIDGNQPEAEIRQYIDLLSNTQERFEVYMYGKYWTQALGEAFQLKDAQKMVNIKHLTNDANVHARADELLSELA